MKYLCFFYLLAISVVCKAQLMGFHIPEGQKKVEVPFEFRNNFIILNVVFEDIFPLKFIFDTGSENTILVRKEFSDLLDISYEREFRVLGADLQSELLAFLVRDVNIDLPNLPGKDLDMLVLDQDYFRFEEYTGIKIHGILGMDLFKVFTIQIDYKKQMLTFYRIEDFKVPGSKFKEIETSIHRNKPYLTATGKIKSDTTTPLKLLLDTGASLSLLLHNNSTEDIDLPEKLVPGKIGNGLGGFLEGYVGRINYLSFSNFIFSNVITNFQEVDMSNLEKIAPRFDRNGIIGNELLSRFTVIFDMSRGRVFLKPVKKYNKRFKFDKSGITIITSGENLENFVIKDLIPNSPASEAGLQKGDIIKNINAIPATFYDLQQITKILQRRSGKRIRLVVDRDGTRMIFRFRLKELI